MTAHKNTLAFKILRPYPALWTRALKKQTQILYTPDVGTILLLLDIKPGSNSNNSVHFNVTYFLSMSIEVIRFNSL